MKRYRGFTLIELMIVVAIIAILCSIAITVYQEANSKAQLSEAFTIIDGVKGEVLEYYDENNQCPVSGNNGFSPASSYSGQYVASVAVAGTPISGCMITATMRNASVSPALQDAQVMFTMSGTGTGSASWHCSSTASPTYLPISCK